MGIVLLFIFLGFCFVIGSIMVSGCEAIDEHEDVERAGMMADELGYGDGNKS